jgi:hypothetical protein
LAHRRTRRPYAQQSHIFAACRASAVSGAKLHISSHGFEFLSSWSVAKVLLLGGCQQVVIQHAAQIWDGTELKVKWTPPTEDKPLVQIYPGVFKRAARREVVDARLIALSPKKKKTAKPKQVTGGIKSHVGMPNLRAAADVPWQLYELLADTEGESDSSSSSASMLDHDRHQPPDRPGHAADTLEQVGQHQPPDRPGHAADTLEQVGQEQALPAAAGPRRGRAKGSARDPYLSYQRYPVHDDDGEYLGAVLYNQNHQSLDAHCERHAGDTRACTMSRTVLPYTAGAMSTARREIQGRPLGFLVAWLRYGRRIEAGAAGRNEPSGAWKRR